MAEAQIKAVITAEDRASAALKNFGNNASSMGQKIRKGLKLAAIATAAAGAAAIAFGVSSVKSYQESENALTQLRVALKATKGVAKVSEKSMVAFANSMQKVTKFSDEEILSAEALQLTFKAIGKDIFPRVTKAAMDMSEFLGKDLNSTMTQLGKAMQDPVKGATALSKQGSLAKTELQHLRDMAASGSSVFEQQTYILEALEGQYKGAAEAAGLTFAGKLKILGNQFDEIKESIGKVIVDALLPFMAKLSEFVASEQFQAWLTQLTTWLQVNLPIAINYVVQTLIPNLINIFNMVWPVIKTVAIWIGKFINFLANNAWAVYAFATAIVAVKTAMGIAKVVQAFQTNISTMTSVLSKFGIKLSTFAGWGLFAAAAVAAFVIIKQQMDDLKKKTENTMNSIMKKSNDATTEMKKLNKKWKAGEISDAEYQRGLARINRVTGKAVSDANKTLDQLGNTWQSKFTGYATSWARRQMNTLMSGFSHKASGTDFFTPRKYAGGTSGAYGGMALVGERGPEMVTLPRGSKVSRADETRKMMGGVTNINITVPMMTGSANERRKVARMLIKDIQDIAQMNGKSVTDMMSSNYGLVT